MHNDNKDLFDYLENIYELHINIQSGAVESIEAKTGQLLSGIGIFLPVALTLIISSTQVAFNNWILAGCATSLLCIISSGFVLWAKQFKIRPNLKAFYNDTKDKSPFDMRKDALVDMQKALDDNKESQRRKGVAFNTTMFLFSLSVLLISWGVLVQKVSFSYNGNHEITKHSYGEQSRQPTKSTTAPTATESATTPTTTKAKR